MIESARTANQDVVRPLSRAARPHVRAVAAQLPLRLAPAAPRGRGLAGARPRARRRGILTARELDTMLAGLTRVGERILIGRTGSPRPPARSITRHRTRRSAQPSSPPRRRPRTSTTIVELELTKEIGPLALKLHTGRSRNEQIATDMRLFVRDAIDATTTASSTGPTRSSPRRPHTRRCHARLHPSPARRTRPPRALAPRLRLHDRTRSLPLRRRSPPHEPLPARLRSHRRRDARPRPHHRREGSRLQLRQHPTASTPPPTATSCSTSRRPHRR